MSDECEESGEYVFDHETLKRYIIYYYYECDIRCLEDQILKIMKRRQEECPSEKNADELLAFSNFVIKRRNDEF